MPTPPKPFTVLSTEKKSHRTKAELAQRRSEEQALLSGETIKESKEVKQNPVAHKEFLRLKKLLTNIQKNDAIYEQSINRYCLLVAECTMFQEQREKSMLALEALDDKQDEFDTLRAFYETRNTIEKNIINFDKQIQAKRTMLLALEKENAMTIAAALRSIPKKQEKKTNELLKALGGE